MVNSNCKKRIFQFIYDPDLISQEDVRLFSERLSNSNVFDENTDCVIVMPNFASLTRLSITDLLSLRDSIDSLISSKFN